MQKSLNMSEAFESARDLFTKNLQLILAVAGVFFVIPQLLLGFMSGSADGIPSELENVTDFSEIIAVFNDFFAANAIWFVLVAVASFIGNLAILVILLDRSRPTVGQAISIAFSLILVYFIMSLLIGFATLIGFILLVVPGIYVAVKFYMAPAIMVAEHKTNPIEAMKASWALSEGNSLTIFFYLLIIGIVILVVSLLVEGIAGLLGATIGLVVSALFGGVIAAFNLAVAAGVYKELRGPVTEDLAETFE